jgi:hypothetical protein
MVPMVPESITMEPTPQMLRSDAAACGTSGRASACFRCAWIMRFFSSLKDLGTTADMDGARHVMFCPCFWHKWGKVTALICFIYRWYARAMALLQHIHHVIHCLLQCGLCMLLRVGQGYLAGSGQLNWGMGMVTFLTKSRNRTIEYYRINIYIYTNITR